MLSRKGPGGRGEEPPAQVMSGCELLVTCGRDGEAVTLLGAHASDWSAHDWLADVIFGANASDWIAHHWLADVTNP